jgi:hypothetical protein
MAIELEFCKGKDSSNIEDEFKTIHPNEKLYGDKYYAFRKEALKFNSNGKLKMHKNNWRDLFREYPWVTLRLEEMLLQSRIKEFSDYPIEYRCGRACLSIMTSTLINLYDGINFNIENNRMIIDGEDIIWDEETLHHIKYSLGLELWEAKAIYEMMAEFDKIREE